MEVRDASRVVRECVEVRDASRAVRECVEVRDASRVAVCREAIKFNPSDREDTLKRYSNFKLTTDGEIPLMDGDSTTMECKDEDALLFIVRRDASASDASRVADTSVFGNDESV